MQRSDLWQSAWRAALLMLLLLVGSAAAFLSGLGGRPLGWLLAPSLLAVGGVALAGLLWWRRAGRGPALGVAFVLAVVAGTALAVVSPLAPAALESRLNAIQLPDGAELVEQRTGGSMLCFDVCPSVHREYEVDGDSEEVVERMRGALRAAGYELEDPADPSSFTTVIDDARHYITGRVEPGRSDDTAVLSLSAVATG